jgi:carbon-monoxide dehydrogenase medium subunit
MKLPNIEYASPTSLDEAVRLLATPDAKILSGGQSLLPMMAYRLAEPSLLVDIAGIPDIDKIVFGKQTISIGSRVRWRDILTERKFKTAHPLLIEAVSNVAHYQIRNRGTIGGSVAHADPAAEIPALALACDAEIVVVGENGCRSIAARDFFVGALVTALEPTDVITEIRLPAWPLHRRFSFQEFARRRGDFALAGVCLYYDLNPEGRVSHARIVGFGATEMPVRIEQAEAVMLDAHPDRALAAVCGNIARETVESIDDVHASARYRRALLGTLVERAVLQSLQPRQDS